jgi:GNAT superfamily N-acetyltransferase
MIEIVSIIDRHDLIECVTDWGWEEWGRKAGRSRATDLARTKALVAAAAFENTFVALKRGIPAAMASLVRADLDERPDLTPWLAGVYVHPDFRGQGLAARVVRRVEQAARAENIRTLWLYTSTAPGLYRKLGWQDHEEIELQSGHSIIMRRDFEPHFV